MSDKKSSTTVDKKGSSTDNKKVWFHDTCFRDGFQSLWSMFDNYSMWEGIAPYLDQAGFYSTEVTPIYAGGVNYLMGNESPFDRFDMIEKSFSHTPLQVPTLGMIKGLSSVFFTKAMLRFYIQQTQRVYKERVKEIVLWCMIRDEVYHDYEIMSPMMREEGIDLIPQFIWQTGPGNEHLTDEHYANTFKYVAEKFKPKRMVLEDVAGLMTPERARNQLPKLQAAVNGIPIELHMHSCAGFSEAVAVEAMKMGYRHFHVCVPPLASGDSHLNAFNVAHNARVLGLDPQLNEEPLKEASRRFWIVQKTGNYPIGAPALYDERNYAHRVPGGVISTLKVSLAGLGMADRLDEVLEEIAILIPELGHPTMATPLSQYIVAQAAMNVNLGRWEEFPDTLIEYAMGIYGVKDPGIDLMDQNVKDRLLSDPRAKTIAKEMDNWLEQFETETVADVKKQLNAENDSDLDFLLKYTYGFTNEQVKASKGLPRPKQIYAF